jgi:hypothetical protein
MQIIDIDLGHAIQAQYRADAAQARLVKWVAVLSTHARGL